MCRVSCESSVLCSFAQVRGLPVLLPATTLVPNEVSLALVIAVHCRFRTTMHQQPIKAQPGHSYAFSSALGITVQVNLEQVGVALACKPVRSLRYAKRHKQPISTRQNSSTTLPSALGIAVQILNHGGLTTSQGNNVWGPNFYALGFRVIPPLVVPQTQALSRPLIRGSKCRTRAAGLSCVLGIAAQASFALPTHCKYLGRCLVQQGSRYDIDEHACFAFAVSFPRLAYSFIFQCQATRVTITTCVGICRT